MGFGKIAKIAAAPMTGGASLLGKDTLLGKKDLGEEGRFLGLDPSLHAVVTKARAGQEAGASQFTKELGKIGSIDSDKLAIRETARRLKAAETLGEDAKRAARTAVAQRGLGRSAVGLSAIQRADTDALKSKADIVADLNTLKSQYSTQKLGQLGAATGGLNAILGASGAQRAYMQGRRGTGRGGGLLGLGLAAGGAYMAGSRGGDPSQGMQAGMGFGRMAANL